MYRMVQVPPQASVIGPLSAMARLSPVPTTRRELCREGARLWMDGAIMLYSWLLSRPSLGFDVYFLSPSRVKWQR